MSGNDAAANRVDVEAWALDPDPVLVGEVKTEPRSGGVPQVAHVKDEAEEEGLEVAAAAGPGINCCSRHRITFDSRSEGS